MMRLFQAAPLKPEAYLLLLASPLLKSVYESQAIASRLVGAGIESYEVWCRVISIKLADELAFSDDNEDWTPKRAANLLKCQAVIEASEHLVKMVEDMDDDFDGVM